MGPPLGPSLVNMFICVLEDKYLNDRPSHSKPVLYRRYVDHTFCLFENSDDADLFFNHVNNYHSSIKSLEKESGNTLAFLHVLAHREND